MDGTPAGPRFNERATTDYARGTSRDAMRLTRALLVGATLALSGCMTDEPTQAADVTGDDAIAAPDAPRTADGTLLHVASFGQTPVVDVTEWHNGTFKVEQHRRIGPLPGIAPTESTGMVEFDITSLVPTGVPTRIFGEVNAELAYGDVDLGLMVPQGEWRTGNFNAPSGGWTTFEVGVVHASSGPIAVMLAYDEAEPQPEFAYTLSIRVVSDPSLLLNGVVAGITLPENARFDVETIGEKRTEGPEVEAFALHVFAPDGAYLDAFPLQAGTTSIVLPEGSPAGEYAILLSQGGRNARVLVPDAPAPLRALAIEWEAGELVELDQGGRGTASATFARAPILVGVFFTSPNVAQNVEVAMSGPRGELFAGSDSSDVPWLSFAVPGGPGFTNGWGWDSLWGGAGLVAGAYEADVAFEKGAGAQPAVAQVYAAFAAR